MAISDLLKIRGFSVIRAMLSFLRWRIIGVRYLVGFLKTGKMKTCSVVSNQVSTDPSRSLISHGFYNASRIEPELLTEWGDWCSTRIPKDRLVDSKHSFVNMVAKEDLTAESPLWKFVFSRGVFDIAADYFGNQFSLFNAQVLYSHPMEGELQESQLWHKDYGDNKTLHFIVYLSDVLEDDSGPFVFTDKQVSRNVRNLGFIRRINDENFKREIGNGLIRQIYGPKGTSFIVDPAQCFHCGSRCKSPRTAIFVSFNTSSPFVGSSPFIIKNKEIIIDIAGQLRPDIPSELVSSIFVR